MARVLAWLLVVLAHAEEECSQATPANSQALLQSFTSAMDEQLARRPSFSQVMDEQLAHRPSWSEAIDERMGRQAPMHQATLDAGLGDGNSDRTIGASEKEGYAMLQERSDAGSGVGDYTGGSYYNAGGQLDGGVAGRGSDPVYSGESGERGYNGAVSDQRHYADGAAYGDDRSYGGQWQGAGRVSDHHNAREGLFGQQDAGNSFEMEDAKIDAAWMQ